MVNAGHFLFSLDDPYIHLALAEQLAHGHYGINVGQSASPSSSIIWPFLLVPFAHGPWQAAAALGFNLLFGSACALLLGFAVARWPNDDGGWENRAGRAASAILLIFAANLEGLTFTGMEHTLQVLLAICCAYGIIACLRQRPVPMWCLVAAAIGPMVRYEALGLTFALAVALWGQRKTKQAAVLMSVGILPLILFGAFLHSIHLPPLPTSVLVKSGALSREWSSDIQGQAPMGAHLLGTERFMFVINRLRRYQGDNRVLLDLLCATLVILAVKERDRVRRFALAGAAAVGGLHILIGRFGWFYRYEVYAVAFSAVVILYVLHEQPRMMLGWYVLGLFAFVGAYGNAFDETISSAHDVYLQQYQMHRFSADYYGKDVAVNDLGLVSYKRPAGQHILDLAGLGSIESARQKHKDAHWLDEVTRKHGVGLVMLYPAWYPKRPATWTRLGGLCLWWTPLHLGGQCVDFYATGLTPVDELQSEFAAFGRTVPPGDNVTYGEPVISQPPPLAAPVTHQSPAVGAPK